MPESLREWLAERSPWKTILVALLVFVVGQSILLWQYRRLRDQQLLELQERQKIVEQQLAEKTARDIVVSFLEARIEGNEEKASRYVTEQAMFEKEQGLFQFEGLENYEIRKIELLENGTFRFHVQVTREGLKQIELLYVRKIGENYYVDSVQLAG